MAAFTDFKHAIMTVGCAHACTRTRARMGWLRESAYVRDACARVRVRTGASSAGGVQRTAQQRTAQRTRTPSPVTSRTHG